MRKAMPWEELKGRSPTIARRAIVGTIGGLLGFFAIWLWLGMVKGWPFLGLIAAVPAVALALVPRTMRLMLLVLGLLLFGSEYVSNYDSGADNPLSIIPFFGLCVTTAAVLIEAVFRTTALLEHRSKELG